MFSLLYFLTLVLPNPNIPCLCKQCRFRSIFDLDLLCLSVSVWICIKRNNLDQVIWLAEIRSRHGILIYSAWQRLMVYNVVQPVCSKYAYNQSSRCEKCPNVIWEKWRPRSLHICTIWLGILCSSILQYYPLILKADANNLARLCECTGWLWPNFGRRALS